MNFIKFFLFLLFIKYVKAQPTRTTRLTPLSKTATSSTRTTTESISLYTLESTNTSEISSLAGLTVSKIRTRFSTNLNRLTTKQRVALTKRPSQTFVYTKLNISNLISVQISNISESNITSIVGEIKKNVLDLFYKYCLII